MLLGITIFSAVAYTKCIRKPRSQRPVVWIANELDAAYFNRHDDSLCPLHPYLTTTDTCSIL
jgi:hypothetical protein